MANTAKQSLGANFHEVNSSGVHDRERMRTVMKKILGRIEIFEGWNEGYIEDKYVKEMKV